MDRLVATAVDPAGALWAVRQETRKNPATLWRSVDRGHSFEWISEIELEISDIDAVGDALILTVYDGASGTEIYRSEDGGRSFHRLEFGEATLRGHSDTSTTDAAGSVYAAKKIGSDQIEIYRSDNMGETWEPLGAPDGAREFRTPDPITTHGSEAYLFTRDRSTMSVGSTRGRDWSTVGALPTGMPPTDLAWTNGTLWSWDRQFGQLYGSENLGRSWEKKELPTFPEVLNIFAKAYARASALGHGELILMGSGGDGLLRDVGGTWQRIFGGTPVGKSQFVAIGLSDLNHRIAIDVTRGDVYVADGNGIYRLDAQYRNPDSVGRFPDADHDGVPDALDAFPQDGSEYLDTNGDGVGNNADRDDDGDGTDDVDDGAPLSRLDTKDFDGDGLGDTIDRDDDGDGFEDVGDAFPLDRREHSDSDGDGVGDYADSDDDGDGVADSADAFPLYPHEWQDTDGDGIGDNLDVDDDNDGLDDQDDPSPKQGDSLPNLTFVSASVRWDWIDDGARVVPFDRRLISLQPERPVGNTYPDVVGGAGAFYGEVSLGDGPNPVVQIMVDHLDEHSALVYFDRNANADLTDDGPPKRYPHRDAVRIHSDYVGQWVEVGYSTGVDLPYRLRFYFIGRTRIVIEAGGIWMGHVAIGNGTSVLVMAIDHDIDGVFTGEQDYVCVDADGDNSLACWTGDRSERFMSGAEFEFRQETARGQVLVVPSGHRVEISDLDTDQDGVGDFTDDDDDGDGVADGRDAFPFDRSEWVDSDRDGVGDNADTDDDNDGLSDNIDLLPNAPIGPEYDVALFPAASGQNRQGFVRLFFPGTAQHDAKVRIGVGDSTGHRLGNSVLTVEPGTAAQFNSEDLKSGNAAKGLSGRIRADGGDWRLELLEQRRSAIEVLSYVRTTDGFLTAMHDLAPKVGNEHWVATFNPGSNRNQVSILRLVNPGADAVQVRIRGIDDSGESPGTEVLASIPASATLTLSAAELEAGSTEFEGALGDGDGKWRLLVNSDAPILVIGLLESPTGHLTNLSSAPSTLGVVPLFPAAGDPSGRQGFVRVINHSGDDGEVEIAAYDDLGQAYGPVTLALAAGAAAHFNSEDLELGYPAKGLAGRTGAGEGDWRLELSSELDIEVLSYIRTADGFLTTMHDIAPVLHNGDHRVVTFNPGENRNQVSKLRLANQFESEAEVVIRGVDDEGNSPGGEVLVSIPPGAVRTFTAAELETGISEFDGALGDGAGKWRLFVKTDKPVLVMSLLESPSGHLTNLSAVPGSTVSYERFISVESGVPDMVEIQAGTFQMGCALHEYCSKNESRDEHPVHEVTFQRSFALSRHEITFAQWDACVADEGCGGYLPDDEGWGRGNRPVVNVSWDHTQAYVDWLSQHTDDKYRLPSEGEWEYAARAGSTTTYSWGNDIGENQANCKTPWHPGCGEEFQYTAPVGSFPPNAWGLHDMHGNVAEWVQDCYNSSYDGAPTDGSAWEDGDCEYRVIRGGGHGDYGVNLRVENRRYGNADNSRGADVGFRVVRTASP